MPRRKKLTWSKALELFELHLRAKRSATRTIAYYLQDTGYLRDHVAPLRPDQVQLQDLREFQVGLLTGNSSRSGKPLSAGVVAKKGTVWRTFFRFLVEEELLARDPTVCLETPRVVRGVVKQVLSLKEIEKLLNAAQPTGETGLRDRTAVEMLYATGLRRDEFRNLDLEDIQHEDREVRVRNGKGGKGRIVPLTRTAYHWLDRYLDLARPALLKDHPDSFKALFLSKLGRRTSQNYLRYLLDGLKQRAGIKKNVTPHTMRRTFATHLLKGGASLRHIQLLLGHESLNTTSIYLKIDPQELRREVLLRHPRERFQ